MKTPQIVKNFENAVRIHEMKGTLHPEDQEGIELRYKERKRQLVEYIYNLQSRVTK